MQLRDIFRVDEQRILITGAGSGIGAALSRGLLDLGAKVVGTYHERQSPTAGPSVSGKDLPMFQVDLRRMSDQSLDSLWDFAHTALDGQPTVLVNCAGVNKRAIAVELPLDDWHEVMDVDVTAAFRLCQGFARAFVEGTPSAACHPRIVNIGSLQSLVGGRRCVAYTAAKHAMVGMTKTLANELGPFGVTVNCVTPGYIKSDMTSEFMRTTRVSGPVLERIPLGRWGSPQDVLGPVAFLCSRASDYITGAVIVVDGGVINS